MLRKFVLSALLILFSMTANSTDKPTILIVGDSLSAAYGIPKDRGWVALLRQRLEKNKSKYQIVNASISGDTSQSAGNRLPMLLSKHKPALVVIAIGANDGLRGLPLENMRNNIDTMIRQAKNAGAKVLLIGMRLPPNYGPTYTNGFFNSYRQLSEQHDISLVPFLLDGFAKNLEMMQADGIHPTAKAQPLILDNVWLKLQALL